MKRIIGNKNVFITIIGLAVLLIAIQWRNAEPNILVSARNIVFDNYQRIKPRTAVATPVRIVDIDDASLKEHGQWPWPRTRIASLVKRLTQLDAAAIAFDVVFAEADRTTGREISRHLDEINWPDRENLKTMLNGLPDNDQIFAEAIAKSSVVLGFFRLPPSTSESNPNSMPLNKAKYAFLGHDPKSLLEKAVNSTAPLKIFQEPAAGIALAHASPNKTDDIVRKVPLFFQDETTLFSSLSIETLRVALGKSTFVVKTSSASGEVDSGASAVTEAKVGQFSFPLTNNGEFNVYYAHRQAGRYIPARDVLSENDAKLRQQIEGNIILIGTSATGLEDLRISALGETISGVSIHAQIIDQILTGTFLSRPDWAKGAEILFTIVICLLILAILPFSSALGSAVAGSVLAAIIITTSWFAFSQKGLLIDPIFPTITAVTLFLLTTVIRFAVTEREKRFVRSAFQHYLAPDLLNQLEQRPESLKLGGEIRDMTLMFMDIRGFTPISEKLDPEELVVFLNQLLSPLSEIIMKHEGAIDKYIGDCIMAFWNAPLDVKDHRRKAAKATLEMLTCVKELNDRDAFQFKSGNTGLGNVEIGIGLNSGEGCVGNLGSSQRFDYSVVGDTVNVAARIESSCKKFGWPLLLSLGTAESCEGFAMLKAGMVSLKGKSQPSALFALLGDEEFSNSQYFKTLSQLHDDLVKDLEQIDWKNGGKKVLAKINKCRKHADENLDEFYLNIEADCC
ncbi:MAG: adenylate/guanylate cyclase domain-containing protein [Hyphomicrobiales bacterium]|nr:adenylate/guanylate cyclase domain-containing protein [Hyphomicrobiales bacterium]